MFLHAGSSFTKCSHIVIVFLFQLQALAKRYMSTNNATYLSLMTDSDISMLGSIMCGFTVEMISALLPVEIGYTLLFH